MVAILIVSEKLATLKKLFLPDNHSTYNMNDNPKNNIKTLFCGLSFILTLAPLKIKVFQNKGYEIIVTPTKFYQVTL